MGLFDIFKTDVKDKLGDFWDVIDDPIKGTFEALSRPQAAVWGGLSSIFDEEPNNTWEQIVEGWKNPNQYQPAVDTPLPDIYDRALNIGLSAATDPLTYIPVVGEGKFVTKVLPFLAPIAGPEASIFKKATAELATNVGARAGSEIAGNAAKGTPLEGIAPIIGGVAGGIAAGGRFAPKRTGSQVSILEEQLEDKPTFGYRIQTSGENLLIDKNFPTIEEAQDFLKNTGLATNPAYSIVNLSPKLMSDEDWTEFLSHNPPKESLDELERYINRGAPSGIKKYAVEVAFSNSSLTTSYNFDTYQGAQDFIDRLTEKGLIASESLKLTETVVPNPALYKEELARNFELIEQSGERTLVRKKNIIFLDNAYTDEALVNSHDLYTTGFGAHALDNLEAYDAASEWIGEVSGKPDLILRKAFKNGDPIASVYYADGQKWKDWAETQETPLLKGSERMVFMYRGEKGVSIYPKLRGMNFRMGPPSYNYELQTPDGIWNKIVYRPNSRTGMTERIVNWSGGEISIPYNEFYETVRNVKKIPIYPESLAVSSHTVDPNSSTIKSFLDTVNDKKVITGEWVPFDRIIGPVGSSSYEKEFLVMDSDLVPDEAYKKIVGVEKNAPLTNLYMVRNNENATIEGYFKTPEEARSFVDKHPGNFDVFPVTRGGAQVGESASGLAKPKSLSLADELPTHTLVPVELTSLGDGEKLVKNIMTDTDDSLVGEPKVFYPGAKGIPIGGGAIPPKVFQDLFTSRGYNPKVAQSLDTLSRKDRDDLAELFVDTLGAKGPDADFIRLVTAGYQKAGKTDQSFFTKANNMGRGMWATGDGSWWGIQGLLTIPRLLSTGNFKDAMDVLIQPLFVMAGHPELMGKYIKRAFEDALPGEPTLLDWVNQGNLHLAYLKGNADFEFTFLDKLPFFKPDAAFMAAGDISRISMARNEWRRFGQNLTGEARQQMMEQIGRAVNRATGVSESPFGGQIGSFVLFAPRFFQSQLETIAKAVSDGSVEGQLARRQLAALIGAGTALTFAANYARGYSPFGVDAEDFDPNNPIGSIVGNPNFLRIRNVFGQDISVFGPWDSLAKLIVHLGSGDLSYARTKFGPLASIATNIIAGENFIGDPIQKNPYAMARDIAKTGYSIATGNGVPDDVAPSLNLAKSLLLPFAWQDLGTIDPREILTNPQNYLNFFGVKNSPLSRTERMEANMANLGMDINDPLDRRQFLADHPEYRSTATPQDVGASQYRTDINSRRKLNEDGTASGELTLVEFRENRKILSREIRNDLNVLFAGRDDFKADTVQKKWVNSYFALFELAQDPITHDIIGQAFDRLESEWAAKNGAAAVNYVNKYLAIDKGQIEAQYLKDMNELDRLGYFDLSKYDDLVYQLSGFTDQQIEDYRDKVSAARSVNPELREMSYNDALETMYEGELTWDQIDALKYAGQQVYANPEIDTLKSLRPELFLWFNDNATWDNYLEAKKLAVELPQSAILASAR